MADILVLNPPAPEYTSKGVENHKLGEVGGWLKEEGYNFDQKSLFTECRYRNRWRFQSDFVDLSVFSYDRLIDYLQGEEDEGITREANKLAEMISLDSYDTVIVPLEGDTITCTRDPRRATALPILKEHGQDQLVVMGGVNLDDPEIAKFPFIDYLVRGDFEIPLQNIFSHEFRGEELQVEPGISCVRDSELQDGGTYRHPLDMKPKPHFDPGILEKYAKVSLLDVSILPYKLGRGCTQNCSFCAYFEDQQYQHKSVEKVVKELKEFREEKGIRHFWFTDQNLFNNPDYIERLANRIKQEELDIYWSGLSIIVGRDQEFFDNLAEGGCKSLYHGIESVSNSVLHRMQKHQTREMVEETLAKERQAGIKPYAGFITDYVDESWEEYQENVDFFRENPHLMGAEANALRIYPSNREPLYQEPERFGIDLLKSDEEDWRSIRHNHNLSFKDSRGEMGEVSTRKLKQDYLQKLADLQFFFKNFGGKHPVTFLRLQLRKLLTKDYTDLTHKYV